MLGIEILNESGNPNGELASAIIKDSLRSGIITLAGHVLVIAPTFVFQRKK